jgi:hypothetical protein
MTSPEYRNKEMTLPLAARLAAASAFFLLGAARAEADVFCSYDGSLCLTSSAAVGRVPAKAFKGPKKPLLVLVKKDKTGAATKNVFLILTEESGSGPKEAAGAGLLEMRLAANASLHPDSKAVPIVLRKDSTAYGYGNGCADASKCRPMNSIFFSVGKRLLKAACPPEVSKRCREALASLSPAAEGKP